VHTDITRETFRPDRHYWGVLRQQGRVDLDADWNEQLRLARHQVLTRTADLVGPDGGPVEENGFELTVAADGKVTIRDGRYYVGGVLCENDLPDVLLTDQPDPPGEVLPGEAGIHLAYLDVWDRQMTALEDPYLRETALGGPDTATRARTVWQVRTRLLAAPTPELTAALSDLAAARAAEDRPAVEAAVAAIDALVDPVLCDNRLDHWGGALAPGTGTMAARTREAAEEAVDPCRFQPGGGFRLQENRLYRVEIHDPGVLPDAPRTSATYKWSRDNGSVIVGIEEYLLQPGDTTTDRLRVLRLGFDDITSLHQNDWVEVIGDDDELAGRPGVLAQITNQPDPADRVVELSQHVTAKALGLHPKLRRWDMPPIESAERVRQTWTDLEAGIQVRFSPGTYHTGDHWLIPARANTGDIEWPPYPAFPGHVPAGPPHSVPPAGIEHRRAPLAALVHDGTRIVLSLDQRRLFPAATGHTTLAHAGGDGQEPESPEGELPQPLQVSVSAARRPVAGARVEFAVEQRSGTLSADGSTFTGGPVIVPTGPDGLATVRWRVDRTRPNHRVRARLLDQCDDPAHVPVFFNARVNHQLHYLGGDGQEGMPGETVEPLRAWVSDGRWPLPGATVAFTVVAGSGALGPVTPSDADGVVTCPWTLDPNTPRQQVQAQLLDSDGQPVHNARLFFTATLSLADRVAYRPADDCLPLSSAETVAEALDLLCAGQTGTCSFEVTEGVNVADVFARIQSSGFRDGAICFGPGTFISDRTLELRDKGHVRVSGVGPGTRIVVNGQEVALRFVRCASVVVRDLAAEGRFRGRTAPGMGGVVTLTGCGSVSVEQVTVVTSPAPELEQCGILTDRDPAADAPTGPVTIRDCDVAVAERQAGIVVIDAVRSHIEGNRVHPAATERELVSDFVGNRRYRADVRRRLVSFEQPRRFRAPPPRDPSALISVGVADAQLTFRSEVDTPQVWREEILAREPRTVGQAKRAAIEIADTILRNRGELGRRRIFRSWFQDVVIARFSPAGERGILVTGTVAEEVRLLHNTVSGMLYGLAVALSAGDRRRYQAGTVLVSGNSVSAPHESTTARYADGIFIGNCSSLVVDDNVVLVPSSADGEPPRLSVDGVRIEGELGARVVVRSNHFGGTTVGTRIRPLEDVTRDRPPRRWVAADNVATTGLMLLAPCAVMEDANVPARREPCPGDRSI
jgi:hypothetical protein